MSRPRTILVVAGFLAVALIAAKMAAPWIAINYEVLLVASVPVGAWMAAFLVQRKLCRPYRDDS